MKPIKTTRMLKQSGALTERHIIKHRREAYNPMTQKILPRTPNSNK